MHLTHPTARLGGLLVLLAGCSSSADRPAAQDSAVTRPTIAAPAPAVDTSATVPADTSRRAAPQPGGVTVSARVKAAAPAPAAAPGPRLVTLGGLDLTGVGFDRGSATAPVVLIDFSDFGCPYCGEFTLKTYPEIEREYVTTGKVFFKYVPFIVGMFPHSAEATRAAECAAEQGKFWPMADHVYEAQKEWKRSDDARLLLTTIAGGIGADTSVLSRCISDRHTDARTTRATTAANDIGVRVTPSFVVDGRPIEGALPLAEFRKVLDAAIMVRKAHQ
ncbi:thioredoxin domain-containing protein [soil metagenome]